MAEIQYRITNESVHTKYQKKCKGLWSSLFGRSSKAKRTDENKDEHEPKQKRFMDSFMKNARQAAAKEVMHIAEKEGMKEVESQVDNNESQPTNTTTDESETDPSTTESDPLSATTIWAKRMVNGAQQRVESLQNNLSS